MATVSLVAAQDAFTQTISAVEDAARFAFRRPAVFVYSKVARASISAELGRWVVGEGRHGRAGPTEGRRVLATL